jgi:hypothetical protein
MAKLGFGPAWVYPVRPSRLMPLHTRLRAFWRHARRRVCCHFLPRAARPTRVYGVLVPWAQEPMT